MTKTELISQFNQLADIALADWALWAAAVAPSETGGDRGAAEFARREAVSCWRGASACLCEAVPDVDGALERIVQVIRLCDELDLHDDPEQEALATLREPIED